MAKKKGLPFVVQPRLKPVVEQVGNENSGIIEIERKGYLTVGEKAMIQNSMQNTGGLAEVFVQARKIGSETDTPSSQVLEDISKEPQPEYLTPYQNEISSIVNAMMLHEQKLRLTACIALIISRIDPNFDPTEPLHPDIEEDLYRLYKEEEARSTEALEQAASRSDKAQAGAKGKD